MKTKEEITFGATIMESPVEIQVDQFKLTVFGTESRVTIEAYNLSESKLSSLKSFASNVYKLGYTDASSSLMPKLMEQQKTEGKAYIVYREEGQPTDYECNIDKIYTNKEEAEKYCQKINDEIKEERELHEQLGKYPVGYKFTEHSETSSIFIKWSALNDKYPVGSKSLIKELEISK